ncbi:NfeD family protein [Sulfitobacter sp. S190]|uniref:NfeD family protein n=1 Tax=Sulfitobacter sp. S190 TaxID=2867022 RepID=UPI0021A5FADF|nr:hypothetical protein [Sulfitobacter sp. S190]UWR20971.1 hypothetical protein K3756_09565 [Sulfitobacter sp. S190]
MIAAEGILNIWWVWVCVALALGLLELFAPGAIFLGFGLAALAMAGVTALGLVSNPAALLALFAGLALVAWIILKFVFRRQSSGARVVTRDINEG